MVYGFEARLTRGGAGVLLLALILLMAGCASGGGDDTAEPGEGDGDTDGNGGFTSDNGDGDAAAGDGDDGTNTDIGDQDFSSDDPDAMQQDGSSGGVGGGGSDVDPQSECVDREEALAMLEGLEVSLPSCEDDVCTQAHCLAANVIPEDQRDFLADCTDTEKCVPDTLIATLGMAPLPICESIDGAEGRCVSTCVPLVRVQADVLPRDLCADDELCAPCFDPITQEATGACGLVCDETQGPVDEPYFFPECCGDIGVCVPSEFVPAGQVDLLGEDSCQGDGVLCAPRELASDRSASPPSCTSLEGAEGRCLAACIPDVARQADQLPKDSCDDGYLCAPCYDPISGADTGACGIGDDPGPTGDPVLFDTCCNNGNADVGVCVPSAIVPSDQVGLLGPDTCVDSGYLCAPADVAAGSYTPDTCVSLGSGEGRCLPACLPDIAAQAAVLDQADCGVGELCAPCWDPITGASTGACDLDGDMPDDQIPVFTFDECCPDGDGGFLSSCVPVAAVPAEQVALLDATGCDAGTELCAPKDIAAGDYVPRVCTAPGGLEARCLPACLPDIAAQADFLTEEDCGSGYLCAPCFDPFTGADTGACTLEGDTPSDSPVAFDTCCSDGAGSPTDLGTCVPTDLVPSDLQSLLDDDGGNCTALGGEATLCAPTDVATQTYVPDPCDVPGGIEGRCMPACLPDIAAQADFLTQEDCATGYLCAPCYDPFTGSATGACDLGGDTPVDPPVTLDTCCDADGVDVGSCVPQGLVPGPLQSLLDDDGGNCTDLGGQPTLCAPREVADGSYTPTACTAPGGLEARCLPACLPDIAAQAAFLTQESCNNGYLCAPCYDPFTGADTGACTLGGDAPTPPAITFDTCCSNGSTDVGTCVPTDLVPGNLQSLLDDDGGVCTDLGGDATLCAPTDVATNTYTPEDCSSWHGESSIDGSAKEGTGRCLPACLPDIVSLSDLLTPDGTDGCDDPDERCAPCFDPRDGTSTGACALPGDTEPTEVMTFTNCCSDLGRCIPATAAGSRAGALPVLTCEDAGEPGEASSEDYLCAPNEAVADPSHQFASCQTDCTSGVDCLLALFLGITIAGQPGVCLPPCILSETDVPILGGTADELYNSGQDPNACDPAFDCAPCVDPMSGESTGACD